MLRHRIISSLLAVIRLCCLGCMGSATKAFLSSMWSLAANQEDFQQDLSTACAHGRVGAQLSAVCIFFLRGGSFIGAVACGNLHPWKCLPEHHVVGKLTQLVFRSDGTGHRMCDVMFDSHYYGPLVHRCACLWWCSPLRPMKPFCTVVPRACAAYKEFEMALGGVHHVRRQRTVLN